MLNHIDSSFRQAPPNRRSAEDVVPTQVDSFSCSITGELMISPVVT